MKNNPFDTINQMAFEVARASLFFTRRYRNTESFKQEDLDTMMQPLENIKKAYAELEQLDDEEVAKLRGISKCYPLSDALNTKLFDFYNSFETVYSRCVPYCGDAFEMEFFSPEVCERNAQLRAFCRSTPVITSDSLHRYLDLLDVGKDVYFKKNILSQDERDALEIIFSLGVVESEAEYMLSYLNYRNGGSDNA